MARHLAAAGVLAMAALATSAAHLGVRRANPSGKHSRILTLSLQPSRSLHRMDGLGFRSADSALRATVFSHFVEQ